MLTSDVKYGIKIAVSLRRYRDTGKISKKGIIIPSRDITDDREPADLILLKTQDFFI